MQYTEQHNISGLLLLIDFEKAFDSLSWSFVTKTLTMFNFGKDIKRWFYVFYKDGISAICQSGFLSKFFPIQRGCRQGDPLSCYIFILCAEILSLKIRSNKNIKGIKINDIEHKLSQFEDDTTIVLDGSASSLNETLNTLSAFTSLSGLKVNFDKTKVIWIGKEKYSSNSIKTKWKLVWNQQSFDMLGIKFHVDLNKMMEINYKSSMSKAEAIIKQWKKRFISPIGRNIVLKTLVLPLFTHLFTCLPDPSDVFMNKLNSFFLDYIWQGTHKIKKDILINSYSNGGLCMVDIRTYITALKTTWIRRIVRSNGKWTNIVGKIVNLDKLLNCGVHYPETLIKTIENIFWKDTLSAYVKLCYRQCVDFKNILNQPLFYNPTILIGGKSIFFKSWYDSGVKYIGDLVKPNGKIYKFDEFNTCFKINSNFLHFQGVLLAVSKCIKQKREYVKYNNLRPFVPPNLSNILKFPKGLQPMRNILNSDIRNPACKIKWSNVLNIQPTEKEWKQIFSLPFLITNDTSIQWFQYRINHRILGTNQLLCKMKIKDNPNCTFCRNGEESIEHLFWDCPVVNTLLQKLFPHQQFKFSRSNFILGIPESKQKELNLLIMFAKKYIYYCKMKEKTPLVTLAKQYIYFQYVLSRQAANLLNKLEIFDNKWDSIINQFTE